MLPTWPHYAQLAVVYSYSYTYTHLLSTRLKGSGSAALCCKPCVQVYVIRTLRQRADRAAVKAGKAIASVTLVELQTAFQNMSFGVDPDAIARMLREE